MIQLVLVQVVPSAPVERPGRTRLQPFVVVLVLAQFPVFYLILSSRSQRAGHDVPGVWRHPHPACPRVRLCWEATTAADFHARLRPAPGTTPNGNCRPWRAARRCSDRLINHRYEHVLPTLITTSLPIEQLRLTLGDRVASRLAEMTERVILDGPDRRRRTAPAA